MAETRERQSPDDIFEAEAGGPLHQAIIAIDARSACETAYENFRYDDDFPADVLEAMRVVAQAEIRV